VNQIEQEEEMDASLESLSARVQRLEDLEAIRTTWRDYCMRLDSGDWPALGDVFTEDAVLEMDGLNALSSGLDGEYRGRKSIINDFYVRAVGALVGGEQGLHSTGHISTNMQIDLRGDEATTLAYFFEIVSNNRVLIGTYQHRFRREEDRWRFAFLRISVRYRARLEATDFGGQPLTAVLAKPV
jgi:SnoaL-like domain